jgi:tetratricopeptide (TPR) repeat protein
LISSSTHAEAGLLATEVLYYLTLDAPEPRVEELVEECLEIGSDIISAAETAAAHYRYAVCLGAKARADKMGALDLIPQMVEQAKRAEELDETIYHGGPSRMLAALYAKSPAWPMSVGDIDSAIEQAEKAMEIDPEWPDNLLWMADVLERDDEAEKARALLDQAKSLMARSEFEHQRRLWTAHVLELEERLSE